MNLYAIAIACRRTDGDGREGCIDASQRDFPPSGRVHWSSLGPDGYRPRDWRIRSKMVAPRRRTIMIAASDPKKTAVQPHQFTS